MAEPSPAPSSTPATGIDVKAPRPFDRSVLEATLADAARQVEAEDVEGGRIETGHIETGHIEAPGSVAGQDAVARTMGAALPAAAARGAGAGAPTTVPGGNPAVRPRADVRLASPGAQALLSAASAPAPVEDRAVDAGRLRVGGQFAQPAAAAGAGAGTGEVTLPVVGSRPMAVAVPAGAGAPPLVPPPAPTGSPARAVASSAPSAASAAAPPQARPASRPVGAEQPAIRPWQPSDDDILPSGGSRHRGRFRLR